MDDQEMRNLTVGHNWGMMGDPTSVEQTSLYAIWLSQYMAPSLSHDDTVGALAYCGTILSMEASYLPKGMASPYPQPRYSCIDDTKRNTFNLRSFDDDPNAGWSMSYQSLYDLLTLIIRNVPNFGQFAPTFRITISNGWVMYAQGGWYPQLLKDEVIIA